jgi:tripeptide aminopeptidase
VLVEDGWENANDGILGADNKSAVATILEVARRCSVEGSPVGLELVFTVAEEVGLQGAKRFDASRLRSEFGYVFDHATPIGEVVTSSPTLYRIEAEFRGKAAHAGLRPEEGRSAILAAAHAATRMPHGRIDGQTTANLGYFHGGVESTNVVAERARLFAEVRSVDADRADEVLARMIDALQDGAAHGECDVDVVTEKQVVGYRQRPSSPAVVAAEAALRACGYEPRRIATGGASDANVFEAAGVPCVNVANGTEHNHEPTERVSVSALEGMLDVTFALLDEAAAA